MIIVGAYFYTILPEQVPTHWNFNGNPDQRNHKIIAIGIVPLITLACIFLFPLLKNIDPKKANYKKFEKTREIFQLAIIVFFWYTYFVSLYVIQHPEINIGKFVLIGIGVLFLILGNYMGKIKQNFFIGIKLPWTLNSETIWNKTSRFGGKILLINGILFIISGILNWFSIRPIIILIISILVLPTIYSYYLFQKETKKDSNQ